ncbi:MAG: amidohydrolase [Clostridia bacterium]|nr:amidohydrolase [Clostridia bacterium]
MKNLAICTAVQYTVGDKFVHKRDTIHEVFFMLIDFHTHAFPDAIAPKAMEKLSFASGGLQPHTDGTVTGLRRRMAADGVDKAVVLNIATNPTQQTKVNDFAASINNGDDLFAFGSVHPDSPDALEELERIRDLGMKGVKLHPDYQGFAADDPRMKPIYRKISSLGLITVFHAGFDYGFPPPYGGTPDKLATALRWFDSPVVAAHWGGVNCNQQVLDTLCGTDVYLDVSFGYAMLPKYYAENILQKHGADRILFGTDTPWHTAPMERRLLDSLQLSDEDKEKIFHRNAEKLLGL